MTINYSTIDVETENIRVKNVNVTFNTVRIYTTLFDTYLLLYCKGHIQMTNNYSTINVETENSRVKNVNPHSIHLEFILHYITLTSYYIVKDTFR